MQLQPAGGEVLATAAGGEGMPPVLAGPWFESAAETPDEYQFHFESPDEFLYFLDQHTAEAPTELVEHQPDRTEHREEKYAQSLSTLAALGRVAIEGERRGGEYKLAETLAWTDFVSAVTEMLKTDQEFRHYLDVESPFVYRIENGQVVDFDSNGTPMVEVIRRGVVSAQEKAELDPKMHTQVLRNQGDVMVAEAVDALEVGETLFVLSMEPKDELAEDKDFWEELGYRDGIAYLQRYSKEDEETLIAGSNSIDMSDFPQWVKTWPEFGGSLPEGVTPNTFIQHGIRLRMGSKQAQEHALAMRQTYYQKRGAPHQRLSATEYVTAHKETLQTLFSLYYRPLSEAIYTGRNNETMQTLAQAMFQKSAAMNGEVQGQLSEASRSNGFNDELGKLLDYAVRYAAVERLRGGLHDVLFGKQSMLDVAQRYAFRDYASASPEQQLAMMSASIAGNINAGVAAGRTYGGCSMVVKFGGLNGDSAEANDGILRNPQELFGGNTTTKKEDSKESKDDVGEVTWDVCRTGCCPSGDKETKVGGCGICLKWCHPLYKMGIDAANFWEPMFGEGEESVGQIMANLIGQLAANDAKPEFSPELEKAKNEEFALAA